MLNSDRSMQHREHRLAFGFAIAVSHGHRGLLMQRGYPLRSLVGNCTIVDEGFLQAFKAGPRICGGILDSKIADHLNHEVRTGPIGGTCSWSYCRRSDVPRIACELRGRWRRWCTRSRSTACACTGSRSWRLRFNRFYRGTPVKAAGTRRLRQPHLQESPTINGTFLDFAIDGSSFKTGVKFGQA
jgi:hypothetical protein